MSEEKAPRFTSTMGRRRPPATPGELGGTLIEATRKRERAEQLATWKAVLEPGGASLRRDRETGIITARKFRGPQGVDVTELLTEGSPITRLRPDGNTDWTVEQIIHPPDSEAPRVIVKPVVGEGSTSIGLSELVAPPDANNRRWSIPIPTA